MSAPTLTIEHTLEVTALHAGAEYALASYDTRATIEIIEDGEDWNFESVEVFGVALTPKRTERWFPAPAHLVDLIKSAIRPRVEGEIACALLNGGLPQSAAARPLFEGVV